jgi:hypothetical protein
MELRKKDLDTELREKDYLEEKIEQLKKDIASSNARVKVCYYGA